MSFVLSEPKTGVLGPSTSALGDTGVQYLRQGLPEKNVGPGPLSLYTSSYRGMTQNCFCFRSSLVSSWRDHDFTKRVSFKKTLCVCVGGGSIITLKVFSPDPAWVSWKRRD